MTLLIVFSIVISTAIFILLTVLLGLYINYKRYVSFVSKNSLCLRSLKEINSEFSFFPYVNYDQSHTYDNADFYETISCTDFLIYQLQYKATEICQQIEKINRNRTEYRRYIEKIETLQLGSFSAPTGKLKKEKLAKIEKRLCDKAKIIPPSMRFFLTVELNCSKINGIIYASKKETFSADTILTLIKRLRNKVGSFFCDREIWNALCRVERGKVSNKMRFAIYERDGYRCRNCGISQSYAQLEIDHIIPIAKGGKSTPDNLQTLCHKCNVEKGKKL